MNNHGRCVNRGKLFVLLKTRLVQQVGSLVRLLDLANSRSDGGQSARSKKN